MSEREPGFPQVQVRVFCSKCGEGGTGWAAIASAADGLRGVMEFTPSGWKREPGQNGSAYFTCQACLGQQRLETQPR
jgi:hypothetical protein